MNIHQIKVITFLLSFFLTVTTFSSSYYTPHFNQNLIGYLQFSEAASNEALSSIAKRYDIGYQSIMNANPQIKNGSELFGSIQIPSLHLLPLSKHYGIIINLPEMRMYYFYNQSNIIFTYPIGIGKIGKTIPITHTYIINKVENPKWVPTSSIREYNLNKGIILPKVMLPGPNNPLGNYAIYLGIPTYLMHSTIYPESVGTRASFGCIRMHESDIRELFSLVAVGTPVAIINQPTKVGWGMDSHFYLEVHPPLEEHTDENNASSSGMIRMILNSTGNNTLVDWQQVYFIEKIKDGVPHFVGISLF